MSVLFDESATKGASRAPVENFKNKVAGFSYGFTNSRTDRWQRPLFVARELWTYCRYLLMPDQSDIWRKTHLVYVSPRIRSYLEERASWLNWVLAVPLWIWVFRFLETIAPPDKKIVSRLLDERPDIVISSPANYRFSTADVEYLKAAKALKIPTAVPVISWDNLTVRGPLFIIPDRLFAWNQAHAEEAVKWHGVPKENIRIIGSPFFDGWFGEFSPATSYEEFAKSSGLSPAHPYFVWLGSSKNIAPDETWLIQEVKKAFENSPDSEMKKMQILVRPHPAHAKQYESLQKEGLVIFPRGDGHQMFSESDRQLFYDTLYHGVAAVNINTSGIIDAILAGKPALAYMHEKYRQSQEETKHFRHLTDYKAIAFVRSPEECVKEIKKVTQGHDDHARERASFIRDFIRPRGLETSAGEMAAREVEELVEAKNKK